MVTSGEGDRQFRTLVWQGLNAKSSIRLRSADCPRFDFAAIGFGYDETQTINLDVEQVAYYDLTYDGQSELTIDTLGSDIDTAIGLYSATGSLIAINDDVNTNGESQLILENLVGGNYILAIGLSGTTFGDGFDVDSISMLPGEATIRVRTKPTPILLGDVNQDGSINLLDIGPFIDLVSNGGFQLEADMNQDGAVNLLDIGPFVDVIAGG